MLLSRDELARHVEAVVLYRDRGWSCQEIGAYLGVNQTTVTKWLHAWGVEKRTAAETQTIQRRRQLEATLPPGQMVCTECGGAAVETATGVCIDCQMPGGMFRYDREHAEDWWARNTRRVE
jgi:hypothetical protein